MATKPAPKRALTDLDPKVGTGGLAGALGVIGVGLLSRYTGYQPTAEEGAAIVLVLGFGVAYLVPPRQEDPN